jgi:hypothetical protein
MQGMGDAVEGVGNALKKRQYEAQESQDKLESAYAEANLLQSQVEIGNSFDNDPEYTTYGKRYQEKSSNALLQASSMISNPEKRAMFEAKAQVINARGFASVTDKAHAQEASYGRASLFELIDKNKEAALVAPDEATQKGLMGSTRDAIDIGVTKGYFTPEVGYKTKHDVAQSFALASVEKLPPREQVKLMMSNSSTSTGGFDSSVEWVLKKEGGYVSNDGGKGPTNLGINSAANPEVDVKSLTPETAKGIYKTKYWDAIGADSLPPALAMVAFDGSVNQGVGKTRQMLNESGGDASKLIEIRRREYQKLADNNPDKYGKYLNTWNGRLDDLQAQISSAGSTESGNPLLQYIPFEKRQEIIRKNQGALRSELGDAIKDDITMAQTGQENPKPLQREDFYLAFGASEGAEKYDLFQTQQQLGKNIYSVSALTPAQQSTLLQETTPKPGANFAQEQQNHELLTTAVTKVNEQRAKDPMAFAQVNNMADKTPIDFSKTDEDMSITLKSRIGTANMMNSEYGTPNMILTNAEASHFSNVLSESNTEQKQQLLGKLYSDIGDPVAYRSVLQQISPDSPITAIAGAFLGMEGKLAAGDEQIDPRMVSARILEGNALLAPSKGDKKEDGTGKEFTMPKDNSSGGLTTDFNTRIGNAYRGNPKAANQALQAVRAFYAGESANQGNYTGVYDSDIGEKAINSVIGNVVEMNKSYVIPPRNMDETTFKDVAKIAYTDKAKNIKGAPDFSDIDLKNGDKPGTYLIPVGSSYLTDNTGKPLVLDMNNLPKLDGKFHFKDQGILDQYNPGAM